MELPEELKGIEEAVCEHIEQIPFGHSQFQIERLIINKESPERSYRQILLEMEKKYRALKEAYFRRRKLDIQIKQRLVKRSETNDPLDRELIDIEIEEHEFSAQYEDKMIKDAMIELAVYYNAYKQFPKFDRAQFELSEPEHWKKRAIQQAERDVLASGSIGQGNIELLASIGLNPYQVQEELRLIAVQQRNNFLLGAENSGKMTLSSPEANGTDRCNTANTDDVENSCSQEGQA